MNNPFFIVGLAALLAVSVAHADDTLTLTLPPSQAALDARAAAAREAREAAQAAAAQRRATPAYRMRPTMPSRGRATWRTPRSTENVIGRLGELQAQAIIYRSPRWNAAKLVIPPPGTYVAIREVQEGWYGVLMADGSIGWLPAEKVRLLDYEVVSTGSGSLPDTSPGDDIYPRSGRPFFTSDAQGLLAQAYKYLGVPYVWGGNTHNGIDCSGFVRNVFAACGYPLPRLGSDQMAYGIPVPIELLQAGDRLYFERRTDRVGVKHTGLYIGNGYFIHSSSSQHGVAINRLTDSPWRNIYVCARR